MDTALIILKQTTQMFLYMLVGYILFKKDKISIKGSRDIATLLIWIITPAIIINSFCVEFSSERLIQFAESMLIAALSFAVALTMGALLFKKDPIGNCAVVFSNCGYMGIPLAQAAYGPKAVLWIIGIIAISNLLQWSYGVSVITGEGTKFNFKRVFASPILISIVIGFVIFVTGLGAILPNFITTAIGGLTTLNAPMAMIVLGTYLAQSDLKKMITTPNRYLISATRLILVPLITVFIFKLLPFQSEMLMTIFIAVCAPVATNVSVYAQLFDGDYPYACQLVTLSTLFSILTMPLMIMLAGMLGI